MTMQPVKEPPPISRYLTDGADEPKESQAGLNKAFSEGQIDEKTYREELGKLNLGRITIDQLVKDNRPKIKPPTLPGGAGYGDKSLSKLSPTDILKNAATPQEAYETLINDKGYTPAAAQAEIKLNYKGGPGAAAKSPLSASLTYDPQGKAYQWNDTTGQFVPAPQQFNKLPPMPASIAKLDATGQALWAAQQGYKIPQIGGPMSGGYQPGQISQDQAFAQGMQVIPYEQATPEQQARYHQITGYNNGTPQGGLALPETVFMIGASGKNYGVFNEPTKQHPQGQQEIMHIEPTGQPLGGYTPDPDEIVMGRESPARGFAAGTDATRQYYEIQAAKAAGGYQNAVAQANSYNTDPTNYYEVKNIQNAVGPAPTRQSSGGGGYAPSGGGLSGGGGGGGSSGSDEAYARAMEAYKQQLAYYNEQQQYYRAQQAELAKQQQEYQALVAAQNNTQNLGETAATERLWDNMMAQRYAAGGLSPLEEILRPTSGEAGRAPEGSRYANETLADYLRRQQAELQKLRGFDLDRQGLDVNRAAPKPIKPVKPGGSSSGGGSGVFGGGGGLSTVSGRFSFA